MRWHFVVFRDNNTGLHDVVSVHLLRWAAERRARATRELLANIWRSAGQPYEVFFAGSIRVLSYREWLEVPHR